MDIFGDSGVSFLTRETLLRVKHGAEGRTIEKRGKDAKESGKHGATGSFSGAAWEEGERGCMRGEASLAERSKKA